MSENITNNPSVPTQVVSEIKFPRFINNLGIIPTSYKDSMSYYETLAWLCKYLEETVIPTVNQNGEATQELQALYIQLNDYVTHYFDNLDVQEEINQKLDEMVEDGTLQEIIGEYLNASALWCFDNITEMKSSTNLINGSFAKTLGYYSKNDGGMATYKIRNITTNDEIDEGSLIAINENLVAELITKEIFVEQFGAKGDGVSSDSSAFQKALNYASNKGELKLNKNKTYLIDNTLHIYENTNLNLNSSTIKISTNIILFYNFDVTDEYLSYNGNGNINIYNGIIDGGTFSFIHGENINIENVKFYNCLNDHFLEICACKDYTVNNCEFYGVVNQASDRQYVECVQIDICSRSAFPHFTNPNNPTYDDTPNKNLSFTNCKFETGTKEGFSIYCALGGHAFSDNTSTYHDNIKILNCNIKGAISDAMRLYSCHNVIVDNCLLDTITKKGIIIDGNSSDVYITNNKLHNCGEANVGIYNTYEDYSKNNIFINNNIFNSSSALLSVSECTNLEVINNAFNVANTSTYVIWLNNSINTTFKNNTFNKANFDKTIIQINANTTFSYCDYYFRLYFGNSTGQITMLQDITKFNEVIVALGGPSTGNWTTHTLKSWINSNFTLGSKFQFNNGETKQLFTIDSTDGKIITSSVASGTELPVRGIYARLV